MELDLTEIKGNEHTADALLNEGENLTVLLREIPSAGYAWEAEATGPVRIVSSQLDPIDEGPDPEAPLVGGSGVRRVQVERVHDSARRQPAAAVHLTYGRPWEDQPLRIFTVLID
jgi:predicted secreted protein